MQGTSVECKTNAPMLLVQKANLIEPALAGLEYSKDIAFPLRRGLCSCRGQSLFSQAGPTRHGRSWKVWYHPVTRWLTTGEYPTCQGFYSGLQCSKMLPMVFVKCVPHIASFCIAVRFCFDYSQRKATGHTVARDKQQICFDVINLSVYPLPPFASFYSRAKRIIRQ